jgi:hypothetical protein
MIEWFAWVQVGLALIVAVLSLINFARKLGPNDVTLGGTLLVALLLVAQIVVSIVAPFVGNEPTGDLLEFWLYLITALILPIGAAFWALTDRTRWSNLILAIAAFSVAVMVYRMLFIWTVQIA